MKRKLLFFILSAVMLLGIFPVGAFAADGYHEHDFGKLQAFLNQPSATAGQSNGQRLSASYNAQDPTTWFGVVWNNEIPKRVQQIGASNRWESKSLAGSLDVSGFTALTDINCLNNALTSLDVSQNPVLDVIECSENQLSALNVGACPKLTTLICANNQLTALDISSNHDLEYLECHHNNLTALNTSANSKLNYLSCGANQLTSLDVSANTALTHIGCGQNKLTALNVSANKKLKELACRGNQLASLDLSANTDLSALSCDDNRLTSLDASTNRDIKTISCINNPTTSIKVNMYGQNISLSVNGNGYVDILVAEWQLTSNNWASAAVPVVSRGINSSAMRPIKLNATPVSAIMASGVAVARPKSGETFINWTEFGTEVSKQREYEIDLGEKAYNLVANFSGSQPTPTPTPTPMPTPAPSATPPLVLKLTTSPSDGKIYTGGRVKISPNITGGTWDYKSDYLSGDFSAPDALFTGLKAGTTRVVYTVGEQTAYVDIVIAQSTLPTTGQDASLMAGLMIIAMCIGACALIYRIKTTKENV